MNGGFLAEISSKGYHLQLRHHPGLGMQLVYRFILRAIIYGNNFPTFQLKQLKLLH